MLEQTKLLLADLVAFPTVSADSNVEMISYLAERLEAAGARVDIMLDPVSGGQKANLWATLGPEDVTEGGIVLSGHSDVVPVADQEWTSDPFEMVERDGRLYGRGTCDMKGFIAVCIAMAPRFATVVKDTPVHFAFTYDEEVGCVGAGALVEALRTRGVRPSVAIIGEPTLMRIIEGHKGCCEYSTRFQGLEGHGSSPDRGVNAVEYAVRYVTRLLELREDLKARAPASSPFEPPWTTVNIGALQGGTAHNVIASKAQVDWEMRPVQGVDALYVNHALAMFCEETLLPAMRAIDPGADIETDVIGEVAALMPSEDNRARQLMMDLTGANTADVVPFGTEAGIFQELGMDVVVCGPGSIDQAHKADEFVSVEQLSQCLTVLETLAERLAAGQV